MEYKYRSQLPAILQALVDEIETAARTEIGIIVDRLMAANMQAEMTFLGVAPAAPYGVMEVSKTGNFGPPRLNVRVRGDLSATTFDGYPAPFAMFAHELLHLRRSFVDRVPVVCFVAGKPQANQGPRALGFSCENLERTLEHAVIEPQVRRYVPEQPLRFVTRWETVPSPPFAFSGSVFDALWICLSFWVRSRFLDLDMGNQKRARDRMEQLGLLAVARAYTDHLDRLMGSPDAERAKEQMVAATCSVLGLRREFIGLAYGPYIRPVPVDITVPRDLRPLASAWLTSFVAGGRGPLSVTPGK